MVKEYINNLLEENRKKIEDLNQEMQDLTAQLDASEQLLAQAQQEKSMDKNIFSPRTMDAETDKEITKLQGEIEELRRHLDYVGQTRETEIEKREEYQALSDEVEQQSEPGGTFVERDSASAESEFSEDSELLTFLNSARQKVEYSLSLIGGNKNRCKSELRSLLQMIRSYTEKVEKNS